MKLILISGDGIGAGKTTLAKKVSEHIYSLADALRRELSENIPDIDWFAKDQASKNAIVQGSNGRSVREFLLDHGQYRRQQDPNYWPEKVHQRLGQYLCNLCDGYSERGDLFPTIAVDDVRYLNELTYFTYIYGNAVTHIHISYAGAIAEPQFDNAKLKELADYVIVRGVK